MDLRKENGPFAKIVLTLLSLVVAATLQNSAVPANRSTFQLCTSWKCNKPRNMAVLSAGWQVVEHV